MHPTWQPEHACVQDREEPEGSAAASSSANGGHAPSGHAAAMRQFREHADNTNDIFLVAAQAIANTLIRADAVLSPGECGYQYLSLM